MFTVLVTAVVIVEPSRGCAADGARDLILSTGLVSNGRAVVIRTAAGRRILDPGRHDVALAGYESPITSPDHRAVAWLEKAEMPASVATYSEPTAAWLFSRGRLLGAATCDEGEPWRIRFDDGGRILILLCSFPRGLPNKHEVLFDAVTGRSLGRRNVSELASPRWALDSERTSPW